MNALRRFAAATAIVAAAATLGAQTRGNPTVPELLAVGGKYLADYEKKFSAVVSEERYEQSSAVVGSRLTQRRVLQSDVIVLNAGQAGWISLRDVFAVDGLPVRDHTDRLAKLVTDLTADSFEQARKVAEESSRFNLGGMTRTINTPTMALMFLRREYQDRSTFTFDGMKTVDRQRVALLLFKEHGTPRLIQSVDNAASEGKFWLDPVTGRVVQTEFTLKSAGNSAKITAHYADQPKLGLWMPVRMEEEMRARAVVNGRADYKNFRKFDVDVATIIK